MKSSVPTSPTSTRWGVGYGLENAKRQKAYEEARQKMEELVKRTANLCAVASTHY